jgi:hypothetical protein
MEYKIHGDPISKMDDGYFKHPESYNKCKNTRYVDGVLIDETCDKVNIEFVVDKVNRSGHIRLVD